MDQRRVSLDIENRSFTPDGAFEPLHPDREVFRYKLSCGHVFESDVAVHDRNGADVKHIDCKQCDIDAAVKAQKEADAAASAEAPADASKKSKSKGSSSE